MSRKHMNAAMPAAVRWLHRFRINGPPALPPDESADWARWSADHTHLEEFSRASRLWRKLGALSAITRPTPADLAADEYDPALSVADWLAQSNAK